MEHVKWGAAAAACRTYEPPRAHYTMESATTMLLLRPMKFQDEVLIFPFAYPGKEHTRTMAPPMELLEVLTLDLVRGINAVFAMLLLIPPPVTSNSPAPALRRTKSFGPPRSDKSPSEGIECDVRR